MRKKHICTPQWDAGSRLWWGWCRYVVVRENNFRSARSIVNLNTRIDYATYPTLILVRNRHCNDKYENITLTVFQVREDYDGKLGYQCNPGCLSLTCIPVAVYPCRSAASHLARLSRIQIYVSRQVFCVSKPRDSYLPLQRRRWVTNSYLFIVRCDWKMEHAPRGGNFWDILNSYRASAIPGH
jgi:hypothetical protein